MTILFGNMEVDFMEHKSIEEQKQAARNTNELLDHLRRIIEQNDERFSFEWLNTIYHSFLCALGFGDNPCTWRDTEENIPQF